MLKDKQTNKKQKPTTIHSLTLLFIEFCQITGRINLLFTATLVQKGLIDKWVGTNPPRPTPGYAYYLLAEQVGFGLDFDKDIILLKMTFGSMEL